MVLHCLQSLVLLGLPIPKLNFALTQKTPNKCRKNLTKKTNKMYGCCCQQGSSTVRTELLMQLHNNANCDKWCTLCFTVIGVTGSTCSTHNLDRKYAFGESHLLVLCAIIYKMQSFEKLY